MKNLMSKYLRGEASEQERSELLEYLRTDEQVGNWLRADMEFADGKMPVLVQKRILRTITGEQSPEKGQRPVTIRVWLAACSLVIAILCGACGWIFFRTQPSVAGGDAVCEDIIVRTQLGEHSQVTLPDGTEVTLNAQSTVRYLTAMPDGKRRVQVEGEAFFHVARDEAHPFVVTAGDVDVTCLGTSFDVRNYADEQNIAVVLADGKVRVSTGEADLTMEPDSRVIYDRSAKTLSKRSVPSSDYTCWLTGEVRYNNYTLEEIATELSRNYHISMIITSSELKQERFTGYLGRASLRNVLDVISLAANMNYHIADDTVVYVYARK
ncbi:MAG: FecR domain-containing protein [Paludibacteraceae bacterium]|nr:FecR domain-containing protein [Paludibacteraceae bacterium]